ncbi:MAG TPA: hypothetical protein VGN48_07590 [Pedococcus sp.]|nr:hypothetical protein [Pedococcus sp.]
MTEPQPADDRPERATIPRGWGLTLGLIVGAGAALGAAALGWTGVVIIVALLVGGYLLLVRWSSWPRPSSAREDRRR